MSNTSQTETRPAMQGNPDKAKAQFHAIKAICDALLETLKEAGEQGMPGGYIYAALALNNFTLQQFEFFIGVLVKAGRVTKRGESYFYVRG